MKRADLTSFFGISVPQASNDLAVYKERFEGNIAYDASRKRYVAAPTFLPKVYRPNADRYLAQLKAISDGIIEPSDTWIFNAPEIGILPIPHRRIDPILLRRLLTTIRAGQSVEILYHSMNPSSPEAIWRRVTPHAFGHDGFRWHLRALCHRNGEYKDFVLSRCLDLRDEDVGRGLPDDDKSWQEIFNVELIPNPELTPSQQNTIALDYNMLGGKVVIPVRRALLYYFEKRLRLDVAPGQDLPRERPIVVANWSDFQKARPEAW